MSKVVTVEDDGVLTNVLMSEWRELNKEEAEEHEREMQESMMLDHMANSAINCYGIMNLLKRLNLIDKDVDVREFYKMCEPEEDGND